MTISLRRGVEAGDAGAERKIRISGREGLGGAAFGCRRGLITIL